MQDTNLLITTSELQLMQDTSFFDMKRRIMQKTETLLTDLQAGLEDKKNYYNVLLPEKVLNIPAKISRGENYLGFPYLVLDFPRVFEKEHVFAFRTMFWWGNHFSFTLHVGGKYFEEVKDNFLLNYSSLKLPGVYLCINDDPWEYHYQNDNYKLLSDIEDAAFIENTISSQQFIKLSQRTELSSWTQLKKDGLSAFELFTHALYR